VTSPTLYDPVKIFSSCREHIPGNVWNRILTAGGNITPDDFISMLTSDSIIKDVPAFISDLARIEKVIFDIKSGEINLPMTSDTDGINPTLQLIETEWCNLTSLVDRSVDDGLPDIRPGREFVLVWSDPISGITRYKTATGNDLLAIKLAVEDEDLMSLAKKEDVSPGILSSAIKSGRAMGFILKPPSLIKRNPEKFNNHGGNFGEYLTSPSFAVQWHITQACDLNCKHCYDRTDRTPMTFDKATRILDELYEFCDRKHVNGQVIFTGGNPLLYPNFLELYKAAVDRGFLVAILGNPASRATLEQIINIQKPHFFQVSLEGLPEHNNEIRGKGHFARVLEFMNTLKDLNIYSMVMLTLTKDNIDQVIPLAEMLNGKTDSFFFNRLSMVGQGADLMLPSKKKYEHFLVDYAKASESNPIMGLKDNLFNIIKYQANEPLFSGCTGYGCGAAFNFIAVLSDGEVHACRKFPSPIGNIFEESLEKIYYSDIAKKYRDGCNSCQTCTIRPVCGGCLAISHSFGQNIFEEMDPYCFLKS
jgi:selenobiotic family peptide radical SAM maturase